MSKRKGRFSRGLVAAALTLALLLQAWFWAQEHAGSFRRVYLSLGQSALWRGANFSQSQKFADYVLFLLSSVPEDLRVVLPPQDAGPKILGTTPMMQFFLLPRPVINCDSAACLDSLALGDSAVLLVGDFPGREAESRLQAALPRRLMFDQGWGVRLPAGSGQAASPVPGPPVPPARRSPGPLVARPASLLQLLGWALPPLAWLGLLTLSGGLFLRRLASAGLARQLALGYGLGLGTLTITLALLSMLGVSLSPVVVSTASAGITLAALCLNLPVRGKRKPLPEKAGGSADDLPRTHPDLWLAGLLFLALAAAFLSVGMGYHASDELLIWGPKGYGITLDQSISAVMSWGTNTVHYPLHIPLLVAASKLLFQESLPASKLVFAGYFAALLVLLYSLLLDSGFKRPVAAAAAAFFGLAPLVFRHATLAYANLPLAYTLLAAFMLHPLRGLKPPAKVNYAVGLFLALAAWTRPEGLAMACCGLGVLLALNAGLRLRGAASALPAVLPLAAYTLFWQLLRGFTYSRPASQSGLVGEALGQLSSGVLHLPEAGYLLRALLSGLVDYRTWGLLGVVSLAALALPLLLPLHPSKKLPGTSASTHLLAGGLMFLLLTASIYYLASYDTIHDIRWWVSTGLERMLLPGALLLYSGGMALAGQLFNHRKDRPAAGDA